MRDCELWTYSLQCSCYYRVVDQHKLWSCRFDLHADFEERGAVDFILQQSTTLKSSLFIRMTNLIYLRVLLSLLETHNSLMAGTSLDA